MRSKSYYLENDMIRGNAIRHINELKCDGKVKITISNAGSKTSKQRGLQWRWYEDIAKSGIGDADTSDDADLKCKWMFARPIFLRDDDFFRELYDMFMAKHGNDPERIKWFCRHMIHTEKFTPKQMAEYLDGIEMYYSSKGVNLTDPREYGLKKAS